MREGGLFLLALLLALLVALLVTLLLALLVLGAFAFHGTSLAVLLAFFLAFLLAFFLVATLAAALLLRRLSIHGKAEKGGSCDEHQFLHNRDCFIGLTYVALLERSAKVGKFCQKANVVNRI